MKKIFICILLLISCSFLYGCSENKDSADDKMSSIMESNNYIIVDVRTKEEYDSGHVVGSINIPYDEIDENTSLDKSKTIMVYCRSGKRSSIAYDTLKELGYDVLDLGAYDSIDLEKE